MNVTLQERINPPLPQAAQKISDAEVKSPGGAIDSNGGNSKVDFKSLLMNSNADVEKERRAKSSGDLSGAKNYEEFLQKLTDNQVNERAPKTTLDKDDFLKLFITQLQNQDPLKPQDGAEMASQLAEFNGVEQMMNVNKGLERLEQAQNASQAMNYINYIGKDVVVNGGRVKLDSLGIGDVKYTTEHPVTESMLEVRDAAGKLVATREMGNIARGSHQLQWDGKGANGAQLPPGNYTFAFTAKDVNGQEVPVEVSSKVKITGVEMGSGKAEFFTNMGKLKFEDIAAIGEKNFLLNSEAIAPAAKPSTAVDSAGESEGASQGAVRSQAPAVNDQQAMAENTMPPPAASPRQQSEASGAPAPTPARQPTVESAPPAASGASSLAFAPAVGPSTGYASAAEPVGGPIAR